MMKLYRVYMFIVSTMMSPALLAHSASKEAFQQVGDLAPHFRSATSIHGNGALVQRTDQDVFPHIASGGGWETAIVIVNIGAAATDFFQRFYDESGNAMQVTFRTVPDGTIVTTNAVEGHLQPGGSFNFVLLDSTASVQVGWATVQYDSTNTRLGGYSAFRLKSGGVVNEGLVPLSSEDTPRFSMAFDNLPGFATGVALCNPASNMINHVTIRALDLSGAEIARTSVTLAPGGHTSFVLSERVPALAGSLGTLVVEGDGPRIAGIGVRMNIAGGMTFTSIPVMN